MANLVEASDEQLYVLRIALPTIGEQLTRSDFAKDLEFD